MRNYRANATKPKKNESQIVDLQRKNMNSELTVTIPINIKDTFSLVATGEGVDARNMSIHTYGALSFLQSSSIMQHFSKCFDQFKLMSCHLCADITKAPVIAVNINRMFGVRKSLEYSIDNGVTWTAFNNVVDLPDPNHPGTIMHVITAATLQQCDTLWPEHAPVGNAGGQGAYYQSFNVEIPYMIAMAGGRVIPASLYGWNEVYVEPTWDEMMSYGNAIFDTKLPGSSAHLSFDIAGSSNSERMMTFPCYTLNKLADVNSVSQQGRFCPAIYFGVRSDNVHNAQALASMLTGIINNPTEPYSLFWNLPAIDQVGLANEPQFYGGFQVRRAQGTDGAGNVFAVFVRAKNEYSFSSGWDNNSGTPIPMTDQEIAQSMNSSQSIDVGTSIQGYFTVRFKQLRSIITEYSYYFGGLACRGDIPGAVAGWNTYNVVFPTNFLGNADSSYMHSKFGVIGMKKTNGVFDLNMWTYDSGCVFAIVMKQGDDLTETLVFQSKNGYVPQSFNAVTWYNDFKNLVDKYDKLFLIRKNGNAQQTLRIPVMQVVFAADGAGGTTGQFLYDNNGATLTSNGRDYLMRRTIFYNVKVDGL